jgi:hypothetical protein
LRCWLLLGGLRLLLGLLGLRRRLLLLLLLPRLLKERRRQQPC